jgi:hypothetical protein
MSYAIGVDLGTSNSVVALSEDVNTVPRVLECTQVAGPNIVEERSLLPSAVYIANASEFPSGALQLPWSDDEGAVVGHFAREHGALIPDRLVTSAKSWLCNAQVDRRASILPWNSEISEEKLSPVQASAKILEHIRENLSFHADKLGDDFDLDTCPVVLTVPASFDAVARVLTHEAAEQAGFKEVVLLEEPQAALYSWISENQDTWREQVEGGDLVLVCDIGGGTADFSLVAIGEDDGKLELERVSVGEHILLGGDNMDLALAYTVQAKLEAEGHTIDHWQFLALVQVVRAAKERLFSDDSLDEVPISIAGKGSSLFASMLSSKITREQSESIILGGYFPEVSAQERPQQRIGGLQDYGLPYASDPALTRHLVGFLANSRDNVESDERLRELCAERLSQSPNGLLCPNKILFNGGVLRSDKCRNRILSVLRTWAESDDIEALAGAELDVAVARGAAYYGRVQKSDEGIRIRSGTARSFYLGVEASMMAVPGMTPPVHGVCVVPQGTQEGVDLSLPNKEYGLRVGETVGFRFFSSSTRAGDRLGTLVERADKNLEESPRLEMEIPVDENSDTPFGKGDLLPVELHARLSELGTLDLWMEHAASNKRWKLEFNLRDSS